MKPRRSAPASRATRASGSERRPNTWTSVPPERQEVRPKSRFLARAAVGRTSCDRLASGRGHRESRLSPGFRPRPDGRASRNKTAKLLAGIVRSQQAFADEHGIGADFAQSGDLLRCGDAALGHEQARGWNERPQTWRQAEVGDERVEVAVVDADH